MKKVLKNMYVIAMLSKIIVVLLGFVTTAIINRMLGPVLKGQYSYYISIVTILVYVFSFGLGQTFSSYKKKSGKKYLGEFVSLSYFHAFILVVLSICVFLFSSVCGLILLIAATSTFKFNILYIAAIEDVRTRDIINTIVKFVYMLLLVVFYFFMPKSLYIALTLYMVEELLVSIIVVVRYKFTFKIQEIKSLDRVNLKNIYSLSFKSMTMLLLMSLNYHLDVIFLKWMSTDYMTGIYGVAVTLANMLWLIPDAFKDVVLHKSVKSDSKYEIMKLVKGCLLISLFAIIGFAMLGEIIIAIMYGVEFLEVYKITLILFMGTFSMVIYKIIHPYYIAQGKQLIVLRILLVSVCLNVILNTVLIPFMGGYGAAIASCLSYNICGLYFLWIFNNEIKMDKKRQAQ